MSVATLAFPSLSLPRRQLRVSVRAFAETERLPMTATAIPASLYEVLRVRTTATQTEIKTAYRSLAKLHHPDVSPPSSEEEGDSSSSDGPEFIEIHNAYATLSDPAARAMYDMSLDGRVGFDRGISGVGFGSSGFYSTRRWETDQCW